MNIREFKVGKKLHDYEINRLNFLNRERREMEYVLDVMKRVSRIFEETNQEVKGIDIGWHSVISLPHGTLLNETTYGKLCDEFGESELDMFIDTGTFCWSVNNGKTTVFFRIELGKNTCKVRKIETKTERWVEEIDVQYELEGDCSGLAA